MNRKINWVSGCYDDIELVYEKAKYDEQVASSLSELESLALREAEKCCSAGMIGGRVITSDEFWRMSESEREMIICSLAGFGVQEMSSSMTEGRILVVFKPQIQDVLGCAMFYVLHRLEKLDGAYNYKFPKADLELSIPIGVRSGMMKYEMLIMRMYPWLSVREMPSRTVAQSYFTAPEKINGQAGSIQQNETWTNCSYQSKTEQQKPKSRKYAMIALGIMAVIALVIIFSSGKNNTNSGSDSDNDAEIDISDDTQILTSSEPTVESEEEYSVTSMSDDKVYADIVYIFPKWGIYQQFSNTYDHYVCECTTTSGETIWAYVTYEEYAQRFDSSVNNNVVVNYAANEIYLDTPVRIHGVVKVADNIASDLSSGTGSYYVIEVTSID